MTRYILHQRSGRHEIFASLLPTDNASSHLTSHYNSSPISQLHNLCSQYITGLWISETSVWDSRIESNKYQEYRSQNFCTSMSVYCRYLGTCRLLIQFSKSMGNN